MRMRRMAGLLVAGGLAARPRRRLAAGPAEQGRHRSVFRLETSGPGGPALCMAAANLSDNDQTPLVAASCQGFGNAAEILELG